MFYWIFDLDDTLYQINTGYNTHVNNGLYVNYSFLKKDKKLKILLKCLSGNKIIMTNSINHHCKMVLNRMDIESCFDQIFDRTIMKQIKPHPNTYIHLIQKLKITKNDTCIFFDDIPINLIMAKKFGWITVLITPHPWRYYEGHNSIDFVFPRIHNAIAFFIKKIYNM
jgi:FMN phosphatase YigB (HAD superfamily)